MKNNSKILITVYTPTYNRAYILQNLYSSLCRQTNKKFHWIIIDDGSSDGTKELVKSWQEESILSIQYYYQENQGKQIAANFAHSLITTELHTCMDSDDYLEDDALEYVENIWTSSKRKNNSSGVVGLDRYSNGDIVGTRFPENLEHAKFSHFRKLGISGDKKFFLRTDLVNKYGPYPNIAKERFPAPGYLYRLIDQESEFILTNKILSVVEYLPDGISKNKLNQLKKNPNAFLFYRIERMKLATSPIDYLKNNIHASSTLFLGAKLKFIKVSLKHYLSILLFIPLGFALAFYIKKTHRKGVI